MKIFKWREEPWHLSRFSYIYQMFDGNKNVALPPNADLFSPISKGIIYFCYLILVPLLCIRSLGERKLIILKFKYLQTERSLTWTNVQYSAILDLELERAGVVSLVVGFIAPCIEESRSEWNIWCPEWRTVSVIGMLPKFSIHSPAFSSLFADRVRCWELSWDMKRI